MKITKDDKNKLDLSFDMKKDRFIIIGMTLEKNVPKIWYYRNHVDDITAPHLVIRLDEIAKYCRLIYLARIQPQMLPMIPMKDDRTDKDKMVYG